MKKILKIFSKISSKKAPEETKEKHLLIMEGVNGIKKGKPVK